MSQKRTWRASRTARALAALSISAVTAATFTACSSDDNDGGGDADSQSLEVWVRLDDAGVATYQRIFDGFTEETGIEIDLNGVPSEFDQQLASRATDKNLPDIFINDSGNLGFYQSQGYLTPIDKSKIDGTDVVPESTWDENLGTDGELYGVPFSRQAVVLVVRKDWREAVGMEQPKTWDDVAELAQAFATEDPDGNGSDDTYGMVVPGTAENGYIYRWAAPYIFQGGGQVLVQNDDGTYRSEWDSPENAKTMEWIRTQFCTPGSVVPGSINLNTAGATGFNDGVAGMYLTGGYNFNTMDSNVGRENVEVVPMPSGPDNDMSWAEGEDIYFASTSDKTDAAYKLFSYMITAQAQEIGMDPALDDDPANHLSVVRIPVNTSLDAESVYQDERWGLVQDAYANSQPYPWNIDYTAYRQVVADGMNAMMATCDSDIPALMKQIDEGLVQTLSDQGIG